MTKKKPTCPKCNSKKVIPIIYGYPSSEARLKEERGLLKLGGCIEDMDAPRHHCKDCNHQWREVPSFSPEEIPDPP